MKIIERKVTLLIFLEADDPKNTLGIQLRIWEACNNTEIMVRIENQNNKAKKLWKDGEKRLNNGQVDGKIIHFLKEMKIIIDPENWDSSAAHNNGLSRMDEYEDRDKCIYFMFFVKKYLIKF